jgi:hypothetical protein
MAVTVEVAAREDNGRRRMMPMADLATAPRDEINILLIFFSSVVLLGEHTTVQSSGLTKVVREVLFERRF